MQITLSQYAGFCDGVGRAYTIVEKIANDPKVKKPVAVLGSLVHNNDVVKKIEQLGVLKIELEDSLEETLDKIKGKVRTLVITAHGMGPKIYELAKEKGFDLVDTTCPRVVKVQRLARMFFDKMSQIVIIGEKNHKEVKGINEWAHEKSIFIENKKELENIVLDSKKKIVVLSQTTQNQEFVKYVNGKIKEKYPQAEIFDSVCLATHHRQVEISHLSQENEVMIIIGSPESANSKRLYEISSKFNKNTYFIEKAEQLKNEWFCGHTKIGIGAGASTPNWVIEEIMKRIKKMSKERIC